MAIIQRLILLCSMFLFSDLVFADQPASIIYGVAEMGSDYTTLAEACSAVVTRENSYTYQYQSDFQLVSISEPNICNISYINSAISPPHRDTSVYGVAKTYFCPAPTEVTGTLDGHPSTCSGTAPPPCPVDNGFVAGLGCLPSTACANGCTYPVLGSQHCSFSVLGISACVYDGNKGGGGTQGCGGVAACADAVPPNRPADALTVDMGPLTPDEKAALDALAAQAAADKAAADQAALDASMASLKAAEASQAAADTAAAVAAASAAAAAKSGADALAVKSAVQAAADSKAAADAVAKSAADAGNPQATQAEKDASAAAAASAIAKAGESAVISASAGAGAAAAAGAASAAQNAASSAIAQGSEQKPSDDFCVKHPQSTICKVHAASNGVCNTGSLVGFTCDGDAIKCAISKHLNEARCADLKTDQTNIFGEQAIAGTFDIGGVDTFANPVNVAVGGLDETTFLSKGCLADMVFVLVGQNITLPLSRLCSGLQTAGKIVLAFAYLIAARIIFS